MFQPKQKKMLVVALALGVSVGLAFADRIYFSYDNAGNRTSASTQAPSTRSAFDSDLNLDDTPAVSNISVYPNPTEGPVNIDINGYDLERSGVIVTDMAGRTVMQLTELSECNVLDLSDNPTGVYLLKVRIGEKENVYKIIKQ